MLDSEKGKMKLSARFAEPSQIQGCVASVQVGKAASDLVSLIEGVLCCFVQKDIMSNSSFVATEGWEMSGGEKNTLLPASQLSEVTGKHE